MSDPDLSTIATSWHIQLRRILVHYFSEEELKTLCFDLRVDYEDLPGKKKTKKVVSLIVQLTRQSRVEQLIELCQQERPNIPWDNLRLAALQYPLIVEENPDQPADVALPHQSFLVARSLISLKVVILAVLMLALTGGIGLMVWTVLLNFHPPDATAPPPATFTAMVEETASATEMVTSPHSLLLSDDFENGQTTNWRNNNPAISLPITTLPDGNQVLKLSHGIVALHLPAWEWETTNYRLEADVMVSNLTPETSIGWHARVLSPAGSGYCQGYRAEIGPGHAAIHVITAAGCHTAWQYETLDYGPFTLEAGKWYHLRLDVIGNQLRLFIDDLLTIVATDSQNNYPSGGVGLMVFGSEEAYADNIVITALPANP
jgi:nitrate reductase NapE component